MGRHSSKGAPHVDRPHLPLVSFGDVPLREVSGLAVAHLREGQYLAAVGDSGPNVALAPLLPDGSLGPWDVVDLSQLAAPAGAPKVEQAEAVATDGAHQAMVLIEDPPLLLVLDTAERALTHAFELDPHGLTGLDEAWRDDGASRGEGMVLMRDGHVLVVKEKRPAGLIEFGPPGDEPLGVSARTLHRGGEPWIPCSAGRLVALAWWPAPSDLADLSDADVGPDGGLYLLSDQDNAVARLALPLDERDTVVYDAIWRLPREITKAEGLAFLSDGTALVAVDQKRLGTNLATLPPLSEWPTP